MEAFDLSLAQVLYWIDTVLHYPIFEVNKTPVTLVSIVLFVLIFGFSLLISKMISQRLVVRVLSRFQMKDGLLYTFQRVTYYALVILGAIVAFQFVGIDLSGLAVIFGLLSVGIGFGLQNLTSNFISGLILLFERPIKAGDRVTVGDTIGDVIAIRMRFTTIRTPNNIMIIVPNSEFVSSRVINWSYGESKVRLDIEVGVSYNSDPDQVFKVLMDVAKENRDVLEFPQADVLLKSFGDSAWNMQLRVWITDPKRIYEIQSDINCAIVKSFRNHDIEIPFPQRDLHMRSSWRNHENPID